MAKTNVVPIRNLNHLQRDRGYRFKDRDPDLDTICRMITDSGISIADIIEEVYDATGEWISYSCIWNWQQGKTKRPSNSYLNAVARALGYDRAFISKRNRRY